MANDFSNSTGSKKAFLKTYGDVMKNIPSGQGADRNHRRDGKNAGENSKDEDVKTKSVGPTIIRKTPLKVANAPEKTAAEAAMDKASQSTEATVANEDVASAQATSVESGASRPRRESGTKGGQRGDRRGGRRGDRGSFGNGSQSGLKLPTKEDIDRCLAAVASVEDADFASLFEASSSDRQGVRRFDVGEKVTGVVVQITGERAFLDLGGKGEGMIEIGELKEKDGSVGIRVGDEVEAYVLKTGGGITLTKSIPKGALREFLADAAQNGIPVEGTVSAINKGGFEIDLGGGTRGFCPVSQMDDHYVEDTSAYVGQRFSFRVSELKDRDIVLSRRALLEEEKAAKARAIMDQVVPGARFDGVVTSVRDFGAFVDLGGVEGLVHVSEMSFSHSVRADEVLSVGQKIQVEVLRIDPPKPGDKGHGRISLSMKAVMDDPWDQALKTLAEGDKVTGTVVRLQPFGAFVEILPGVDGLIHISALGADRRIAHPKEVVSEGDQVECVIESMDADARRIGLRRLTAEDSLSDVLSQIAADKDQSPSKNSAEAKVAMADVGDVVDVTVDKVESFGVLVTFANGKGLVPASETGTIRGTDLRKTFPVGTSFRAEVIEKDSQGRLRLSKAAAEKSEERREVEKYLKSEREASKAGFGTFADLFKKMKK